MWDLWWTDGYCDRFLCEEFFCTLLFPVEQSGEAWQPSKKQCCFGNVGAFDRKGLSLCLQSVMALLVLRAVGKLSSVRGARSFIYVFTKAHLFFCPVSDVSWPQLLIAFIWVSICLRLRLFLPIGLFLSRFCVKTSHVFITVFDIVISLQGGRVRLSLKFQTAGPPFLGCPPLSFQHIFKNFSHYLQSEDIIFRENFSV